MGCDCRGGAVTNTAYKIVTPDGTIAYRETVGEARVIRAAAGPATVIQQVNKSEMEAFLAKQE